MGNKFSARGANMMSTLRNTARRNMHTLAEDALGAIALMVILVGALHLPVLV